MRIHHLNCGTFKPPSQRLINGTGRVLAAAEMVTHCWLVQASDYLILVDAGIGLLDVAHPQQRIGSFFLSTIRPVLDEAETALRQIQALGFAPRDVRKIVVTHLDIDHAGGLADFPQAEIHVSAAELDAAYQGRTAMEKNRYRHAQWAHGPRWVRHGAGGERWQGFSDCQALDESLPEVVLVALPGHTRGHLGVAVRRDSGWLLHCGDAYYNRGSLAPGADCPAGLRLFQRLACVDNRTRTRTQAQLGQLARGGAPVQLCCAHDENELAACQREATKINAAGATGD